MKNTFNFSLNSQFIGALLVLISITVFGAFNEDSNFLQTTKLLYIPVFLLLFLIKNRAIKVPIVLCLLYSFLGDSASMVFDNYIFLKASSIMYFFSYLCLISFVAPTFKFMNVNKLISAYLVLVVLINIYFLYTICSILKTIVPDSLEVFLFGIKSVSLVVLLFISFGVYLNSENKMSILFLLMAVCFVFSDSLNYVSQYYVYHWIFVMLDGVFHVIGLFFLFNYLTEYNKSVGYRKQEVIEDNNLSAKNVLA